MKKHITLLQAWEELFEKFVELQKATIELHKTTHNKEYTNHSQGASTPNRKINPDSLKVKQSRTIADNIDTEKIKQDRKSVV